MLLTRIAEVAVEASGEMEDGEHFFGELLDAFRINSRDLLSLQKDVSLIVTNASTVAR